MYRSGTKLEVVPFNFVLHQGGLGDAIAQLPAVKFVLDHHFHIEIKLWTHEYFKPLAKKVFEDYNMITVESLNNSEGKYNDELLARSPYVHKITNLASHLTDQGFLSIVGRSVEDKYKNYIQLDPIDVSEFNLPEKYFVITTGYTSDTRVFKPEIVKQVSDYCVSIGYTPVYIGKSYTPSYKEQAIIGTFKADYSNGINLIDKTNLFQAHAIMNNSTGVLGVDNGLIHLAGMGKAPIIVGFTSVDPYHRLPYRDGILGKGCYTVVPDESLKCRYCQSNMNFAPNEHSFTTCAYQDYLCNDQLISNKWIEQINRILK
jgi:ADP-heptose:LPS heptosyltransferase